MIDKPILKLPLENHGKSIILEGAWTLRSLAETPELRQKIKKLGMLRDKRWDISHIERLDSAGAFLLWQAWGERLPDGLTMRPGHQRLFDHWRDRPVPKPEPVLPDFSEIVQYWQVLGQGIHRHVQAWLILFSRLILDLLYLLLHPRAIPFKEISATIFRAGVTAMGITALVGFLVGVSLSYLSALQLQQFGAEIYIIDLLGLSIIRELGPVLAAILIAGRSGSSMAAEIGIMRVTQELDALSALGISHSMRLVLPKVVALSLAVPLLIVWTDVIALIGGMLSADWPWISAISSFSSICPMRCRW